MKAFTGFKSEASGRKSKHLPAGPYVAKIKGVKIDGQEPDQTLVIRLDVEEGEYKNHFLNRFMQEKENSKFEPKYKGDFRLRIPNDDNTKALYPESDLKRFNDAIYRIEQSNPGYHWNWDEKSLVGLLVGINMQQAECNGFPFTKIGRLEIAEDVRKGIVKPMEPQKPKGDADDSQFVDQQSGMTKVDFGEELPF